MEEEERKKAEEYAAKRERELKNLAREDSGISKPLPIYARPLPNPS